jgi:hypothetical protein
MRILLIEDDPMIGRSLTAGLGDDGYAVDCVCDGTSAIAALGDRQAAFALALLDWGLPRQDGLADPEISAPARLWSSSFDGDVGIRSSIFAVAGVKTDWGANDRSSGGERLDEHVQPGTGLTDWFLGLSGFYQLDQRSALFASAQYRATGRNDFGYRHGSATLLNFAYQHKIGARLDAVLEANFRDSRRDEIDAAGTQDGNTGGAIAYLTPRILFDLGHGWVLRASAQLPLSQSGLHGVQREEPVQNAGMTRLFGKSARDSACVAGPPVPNQSCSGVR